MKKDFSSVSVVISYRITYNIGTNTIYVPEALFQPSIMNVSIEGVHKAINDSIEKCDIGIRKDLYSNIILSGGTTALPGLGKRIVKEIDPMTPPATNLVAIDLQEKKYLAWLGASKFASFDYFS